jgi:hypothetical protein
LLADTRKSIANEIRDMVATRAAGLANKGLARKNRRPTMRQKIIVMMIVRRTLDVLLGLHMKKAR